MSFRPAFVLTLAAVLSAQTRLATTTSQIPAASDHSADRSRVAAIYSRLPLSFEPNQGQVDPEVRFLSHGLGYNLFLTSTEAVMSLRQTPATASRIAVMPQTEKSPAVLRMKLIGANAGPEISGEEELPGKSNYFAGKDSQQWRTNIPNYAKVRYHGVYPGVDLVYYGNQRQLEYDFIVAPGADARRIQLDIRGAQMIRRNSDGELVVKVGAGEVRWHKPVAYQEIRGKKKLVAARYTLRNSDRVGFEVAKYDASQPLFIDPLVYSTFLGGNTSDQASCIAVDSAGNAYVGGLTLSRDFPTKNPLPQFDSGGFVSKINAAGTDLVYSTFLGVGNSGNVFGIAVDANGNAYVTGNTGSASFPTTPGAFQTTYGGTGDAFVTKINAAGSALVYSSFLGGSWVDWATGIALDSHGSAYVTGVTQSDDFPTTPGAPQRVCNGGSNCDTLADAFITKVNPSGSAMVYSTYLGGSQLDWSLGIGVDAARNAYVAGFTESADFPVTPGAFQTVCDKGAGCSADAFVAKIDATGSRFEYVTYLGGSSADQGYAVGVDSAGNAYVTGFTDSPDFPTTPGALQTTPASRTDAFVTKLNPSGSSLVYSTFLGGNGGDVGYAIAVDRTGSAYVTGPTGSTTFPVKDPLEKSNRNRGNFFVSELNPAGSALFFSTYFGGTNHEISSAIAVDTPGNAYVAGTTYSSDYPTSPGAFQTVCNDGTNCRNLGDAFVTKMHFAVTATTLASSANPSVYGQSVIFTSAVCSSLGPPPPDGETVTFLKGLAVLGTQSLSGGQASVTTSTLKPGTKPIKAVYGGDSNLSGSTSKTVMQVVNKASTTTTLKSSQNPSSPGQAVTFTAHIVPQFSGSVTGSVTFFDGATTLATVAVHAGNAMFTTSALTSGAHVITATYGGSTNFNGSSDALTQNVN